MINTVNSNVVDALKANTRLKNYVILSILGRGAFGITYLALDQDLDSFVAIKEYLPYKLATRKKDKTVQPFPSSKSEHFYYGLKNFIREAKTLAKFKHPNIVRISRLFEENKTAYIVMQYEKGKTLKDYVEDNGDVSEQRLLEIFCPIHDGLLLVHRYGYIHRDIKPTNILIREDNTPVLIDFGAARNILNFNSADLTQIFTPGYAPLEQCFPIRSEQGPWTDIYALGATLYFAITGTRIEIPQKREENDSYISLVSKYHQKYHHHFLQAIDHSLALFPEKRPQSLEEWNVALKSAFINKENRRLSKSKKSTFLVIIGICLFIILYVAYYFNLNNYSIFIKKPSKKIENISILKNNIPEDIEKLISLSREKLTKDNLSFNDAVIICHALNSKIGDVFYKELREIYLISFKKTLSLIPKNNLKNIHVDWVKNRENNIEKNKKGIYKVSFNFKKEILENLNLYANLTIESDSIPLSVEIEGSSQCTNKIPCKTPFEIKKIQPGEKKIKLINKNKKININSIINVHPNQNYILRVK